MHQRNGGQLGANMSGVRSTFAAMAIGSILAGLMVYFLQARLGIPEDTAGLISAVFLIAGVADLVLVYFWERIFKRRS